jgi:ATP-binding cassette subfamily B protein
MKGLPSFAGIRSYAAHYPRTFRLIWKAAPRWTSAWATLLVLQGILPVVSVYLTKLLVDSLVGATRSGNISANWKSTVVLLIATACVMVVSQSLQGISEWIRIAQSEYVQDYIKQLIHEKATTVDLAFFESSRFHDKLERARHEASSRSLAVLESCGSILQSSITLVAMAAVVTTYGWWLPIFLLVSTLPALYVVLRYEQRYHKWWKERTPDRRWIQYYDYMLTDSYTAAEVRTFGLGPSFKNSYKKFRDRLRDERLGHMRRQNVGKFGANLFALFMLGIVMLWMVWRVSSGTATLGDLALFYQAANNGQDLIRNVLSSAGRLISNSIFLESLYSFLDMSAIIPRAEKPKQIPEKVVKGLEFDNVSFRYPESERNALSHFNLFVPAGRTVAIVGANGAGKSTLIKLICRFFDPQQGSVKIDGVDIRDYKVEDLWKLVTVLFQFPLNYHASASESIALGDVDSSPSHERIEQAAKDAGAHEIIERLPKGYDTLLGKYFADGVQLSGGEYQRVAMARAYLRQSQIILLDEPTSFMDSWSEADWFDRFRSMATGRTGIIITHRFTIAMRADIIFVMDDGQIVESGSHHSLLEQDGMYAKSWKEQMEVANSHPPLIQELERSANEPMPMLQ